MTKTKPFSPPILKHENGPRDYYAMYARMFRLQTWVDPVS
jgi:hypothetical protein